MFGFSFMFIVLISLCRTSRQEDDNVPLTIVGLFDNENSFEQQMFELAVQKVNIDPMFSNVFLKAKIQIVDSTDTYKTSLKVCENMQSGIGAIFGPSHLESSNIVQSLCETVEVPRIETSWENTPIENYNYYFNPYPEPTILAKGYTAIVHDMDWKSFTLLYQRPECLERLQDLIQDYSGESKPNDKQVAAISILQLPEGDNFRPILKDIKKSLEGHIVLDCDADLILTVFKQAKEVNLLDDYHSFIITSLDAHTVDFSGIVHDLRTNITTVRLIDPSNPLVENIVKDLNFVQQRMNMNIEPLKADKLTINSILIYDAIHVFAQALKGLGMTKKIVTESLQCLNSPFTSWSNGFKLINFMRVIETDGLSGILRFNNKTGHRSYFTLEMVELVDTGFKKIGLWDPERGMTYTRTSQEMLRDLFVGNKNKTFIVASKITEPYLMLKEGHAKLVGNDKYEGYVADLIQLIAKEMNITYEFNLISDGNGKRDKKTNKWNGIIGEVQEMRADLGVCDLTITHERRSAVDFTMPFMNLGISILFSKPEEPKTNLFSFTQPLSFQVWIFTATAYLGLSLVLFFLARITPNEWQNPHPCNPHPEELENSLSLLNCLWFSMGSILCQGSDILPRAFPTRLCAAMWWFFALIMTQSYTANWTAFLTSNRMETPIKNVEDLDKKGGTGSDAIKYGCVTDQSTASFFQNSDVNLYQKMWSSMELNGDSVMVSDNKQGVDRVRKERNHYAFFMESSSIEYEVQRNCDLTEVGYWLDNKAYGIAMPFNAPHRTSVNMAVLRLSESGALMQLKNQWWSVSNDKKCKDPKKDSAALDVNEVGGMFVILIFGCLIAFLFSILEFLWNIRKVAVEEKLTLCEAFMVELKFVLKCHGTSKPVRRIEDSSSDITDK
ncbi:Ionotropic glutamate receptor, L-glutamate and glycine-binding domain,Receptor, ligand binding [Cinara cedri]|uniref:Ionotropic glutamate receptor, L-glutamate and glycine-binding domain,Receptor, ligand binding n=1 Tax=Cinara cedri TaxID=506608 RepID=A0A5E4MH78_9HEMI|nr:Ionotropic glutamate receptor, L-glutamate and glycine-binding domain,Receptor, ligand binding [Cinara cedri]